MGDFEAAFPEYAATSRLDDLRATEYSYLDEGGHVYLDYTGAGLPARSQLRAHASRIGSGAYGNPHSENPTSSASTRLVEEARSAVLAFFNASPRDYAVIFTPNATGACRLVAEAYPWRHGKRLVLAADNHNSVNGHPGVRRRARCAGPVRRAESRPARERAGPERRARPGPRAAARPVRLPGAEQLLRRAASARLGGAGAVGGV